MTANRHHLLSEELIEVRAGASGTIRRLTLPDVFESLTAGDELTSFSHLQAHQSQAWYCFLCQLAAIAMNASGVDDIRETEGRWTTLLEDLTNGAPEPWCLSVTDLSKPGFFQPPVPEGEWSALDEDKTCDHPDDLDLLVTSANHDVKITRIHRPEPDHWLYALVSLQTMANYAGWGNYGIARKSSGYSCRPFVGLAPGLGWGERFRRDVAVLLEARDAIARQHGYAAQDGLALLYRRAWNGTDSIPIEELDPYFIEVCRRVRLQPVVNGRLRARRTTSRARRVAAKELQGNVGDPWTPVRASDGTALNVSGSGFHYELVADILLTGEFRLGAAGRIQENDPDGLFLICQALSRGQGQTNGLHERIVPIPAKVRRRLMDTSSRQQLGQRAQDRIEFVASAKSKALRPALCALFQGDPEELDFQDDRPRRWLDRLDRRVDRTFFPHLWQHTDLPPEEAFPAWQRKVLDLGEEVLEVAMERASVPEPRRYRGWAGAERIYSGARRRLTGAVTEERGEG